MRFAIVGCGPGGLAAALLLHQQGHEVTLLERFPAPRPMGSGIILQPTGMAVLRELGLGPEISALGQRLDHMLGIATPRQKTVLRLDYRALGENFHGIGVHRAALFDVLYAAVIAAGIEVRTGTEVTQPMGDNVDITIDASGAGSQMQNVAAVRPKHHSLQYGALWGSFDWPGAPFEANQLEQRYVAAHTMIGVLPIGTHAGVDRQQAAFFWSLKASDYEQWRDGGLDVWKHSVRNIWPAAEKILEQIERPEQMTFARYHHCTLRKPYGPGVVFIGDAAHATSPQLGQGANMALLDAWSLAQAFATEKTVQDAVLTYARSRRWHVRAFQLSSLLMTPFYQSDSRLLAALRDLLFDPISRLPIARRIVAGLVSGMLASPPKGLDYSMLPASSDSSS